MVRPANRVADCHGQRTETVQPVEADLVVAPGRMGGVDVLVTDRDGLGKDCGCSRRRVVAMENRDTPLGTRRKAKMKAKALVA